MAKTSTAAATPEPILAIAGGFMASQLLFTASEVGIFRRLAESPAAVAELAAACGTRPGATRVLADAMVALGLVGREGSRYRNGPVADAFLGGPGPADLAPLLRFWQHLSYPAWVHLGEVARSGQPAVAELTPELQRIFSEGVEAFTAGAASALAAAYDFRGRRVLDLGGGTGSFIGAILDRYPEVEATLFETPAVAAVARGRLEERGVRVVEGDFFVDPIPKDHDAVILANVLHLLSPERNLELLGRVREVAQPGTDMLLVDLFTNPTHTEPPMAPLMAGEFLIHGGEGAAYSEEEVRAWLRTAGWEPTGGQHLDGPARLQIATIGP
jgi:SAM-dependent methyltransferase